MWACSLRRDGTQTMDSFWAVVFPQQVGIAAPDKAGSRVDFPRHERSLKPNGSRTGIGQARESASRRAVPGFVASLRSLARVRIGNKGLAGPQRRGVATTLEGSDAPGRVHPLRIPHPAMAGSALRSIQPPGDAPRPRMKAWNSFRATAYSHPSSHKNNRIAYARYSWTTRFGQPAV